jgi:hypothetical protein
MVVHVSDPAFVHDLLASLRRANYSAAQTSPNTVEVTISTAASVEQARLHLGFYLANWRARHPGIVADLGADTGKMARPSDPGRKKAPVPSVWKAVP